MSKKIVIAACILLAAFTLFGIGLVIEGEVTSVESEKISSERVIPGELTEYSALSTTEQKQFRETLDGSFEYSEKPSVLEHRFIQLDNEYYYIFSETSMVNKYFLMLAGLSLSLIGTVELRSNLDTQYSSLFTGIVFVVLLAILVYPFLTGFALSYPEPAISKTPVSDVNTENVIDIQYIRDAETRDQLYKIMEGGESVPESSLTESDYAYITHMSSSYVERYDYIASDGEYYKLVVQSEGTVTESSLTSILVLILVGGLFSFGAIGSFDTYIESKKYSES